MLDDLELAAIQARADAATPGPWRITKQGSIRDGADKLFAPFAADFDKSFIASSRCDVPALIASHREANERIVELEAAIRYDSCGVAADGESCWCGSAMDDPRLKSHTTSCVKIRAALAGKKGGGKP